MKVIQKRLELVSGEVEQFRRMRLFGDSQCDHILKMRKHFEYKIDSPTKNLQDFLDYIEYEKKLLDNLRLRQNAKKITKTIGDVEQKIVRRIKELYEMSSHRFKDDAALSLAYFKFCKQVNNVNAASAALSNMLKNHSHNPEMWQVAAKWYAYDCKDTKMGLKIICDGLMRHKESSLLYKELIQLEIHDAQCNSWNLKDPDQQKSWVDKLCKYIKTIINNIKECEYYVELLEYLGQYSFTVPAQDIIIEHLVKNYPFRALTWNILAQRDWKGLPNPLDNEPLPTSTKTKLTKCVNRYREGLKRVFMEEKELLWSFYINCIINVRKGDNVLAVNFKTNCLKEVFEQAFEEGYLHETYYIQWLDLVNDSEKLDILQRGIKKIPQSVELWQLYLKTQMLLDDAENVQKVFESGVSVLKGNALPLWTGIIRYYLLSTDDEDIIETIYEEGVRQPQEVSDVLKPKYLNWLVISKGIEYTRERYFALAKLKPYCKDLHITMSKLESMEMEADFEVWDKVHELACQQFGGEDVEVWLNKLQYYIRFNKVKVSRSVLEQIYSSAQKALPDILFINFEEKYNTIVKKINI